MSFGCSRACSTVYFVFCRRLPGAAPNSYNCGGGCHKFIPLLMPFGVSGLYYDAQSGRYRWAVAVHILSLNSYSSACTPKRPPPLLLSFSSPLRIPSCRRAASRPPHCKRKASHGCPLPNAGYFQDLMPGFAYFGPYLSIKQVAANGWACCCVGISCTSAWYECP